MPRISQIQQALARKALLQPNSEVEDLYCFVRHPLWLRTALEGILDNTGARTPGIDGVTRKKLDEDDFARADLVDRVAKQLADGTYRPSPVRRIYIPKPDGRQRPLGIPTIADRMVQEALRMVLEPIYESHFLQNVSFGFRPGLGCFDAVLRITTLTNNQVKAWWVVEGDIKGCFDNIPHDGLMRVLTATIKDRRLLRLIRLMLAAGYVEDGKLHTPNVGTPQGGVVSPLLANIYLHEMDKVWLERYGNPPWRGVWYGGVRNPHGSRARRPGEDSVFLVRYADDFLLLTNGPKERAYALKSEFHQVLDEMGLQLSETKTVVTHLNDGFDFLGFHFQRRLTPRTGVWTTHVVPTEKNVRRLREKVATLLSSHEEDLLNKIRALNPLLRGWGNYYSHIESSGVRKNLDHWVWHRVMTWLCQKHGKGRVWVWDQFYGQRDHRGWKNWGIGGTFLYLLGRDTRFIPWRRRQWRHPYLSPQTDISPEAILEANPLPNEDAWRGTSSQNRYAIRRVEAAQAALYHCTKCGSGPLPLSQLHAHHPEGKDTSKNVRCVVILCDECHKATSSYGRPKRLAG